MKIEQLSAENFKGLKSLEFEPKGVNLITGRNNTGKTSLLEAIDLLFNPKDINDYGLNYIHLIREDYNHSEISAVLKDSSTTLRLEKLDHEEIWDEFIIYRVDKYVNRVKDELSKHLKRIKSRDESELDRDRLKNIEELGSKFEKLEETLYEAFEERFEDLSPSDVLIEPMMIFKDEKEYPFVKTKMREIIDRDPLFEVLENEIETWDEIGGQISLGQYIPPPYYRFPSRGFIRNIPEGSESLGIIENLDPRKLAKNEDDEKVAVKEDDIEEYIKEKELLENLKSFSLNQLVFKKNGEKYGVPFEFMGDGFKTIVGILWHLMEGEYEEDIVLIEEPENHMHPGYTRELVYFLTDISRKHDTQFFITTHNRDFIEGFFGQNLTEDEIDYLEKEFLILNLSKHGFNGYDYGESKSQMDDLLMDLRGI